MMWCDKSCLIIAAGLLGRKESDPMGSQTPRKEKLRLDLWSTNGGWKGKIGTGPRDPQVESVGAGG